MRRRPGPTQNVSMPIPLFAVALAYLVLAVITVVLTVIDLRRRRLPNAIVLPAYPVILGLLALACFGGAEWSALGRAVVGSVVLCGFYAILRLLPSGGMGGGDVKLAAVIGLSMGWVGWGAVVVGGLAAFLLGGMFGTVLLLTRRADRRTAIPFGPWMLLGTWIGIIWGEVLALAALPV